MIEHYRYSAFGEIEIFDELGARIASTQIANTITWNTRRLDSLTGFYLYKYRYYSPQLGRWPSRDPLSDEAFFKKYIQDVSDEQVSVLEAEALKNPYNFVTNAPISKYDRFGLGVFCVCDFLARSRSVTCKPGEIKHIQVNGQCKRRRLGSTPGRDNGMPFPPLPNTLPPTPEDCMRALCNAQACSVSAIYTCHESGRVLIPTGAFTTTKGCLP